MWSRGWGSQTDDQSRHHASLYQPERPSARPEPAGGQGSHPRQAGRTPCRAPSGGQMRQIDAALTDPLEAISFCLRKSGVCIAIDLIPPTLDPPPAGFCWWAHPCNRLYEGLPARAEASSSCSEPTCACQCRGSGASTQGCGGEVSSRELTGSDWGPTGDSPWPATVYQVQAHIQARSTVSCLYLTRSIR